MSRRWFVLPCLLALGLPSCSDSAAPGSHDDGGAADGAPADTTADHETGKPTGERCQAPADCLSGFCVDGTCCSSECTTSCKSCDNPQGECVTNVPAGEQDTNASPGCRSPNACDGAGTCRSGSGQACTLAEECASGHCVDGVCCENACDATCRTCANIAGTCTSFVPAGEEDPNGAPACTGGYACDGAGGCRKIVGQPCSEGPDCVSGFCADGTCCQTACTGRCERCDATPGTCTAVVDGEDPDEECVGTGTCGGVCDGNRSCRYPESTVICVPATCTDGIVTNANTCDGAGHCLSRGATFCDGFACLGTACRTTCGTDYECATGWTCELLTGRCNAGGMPGDVCANDTYCANWYCAGGHCCAGYCNETHPTCGGSCDGAGVCTYPDTSTVCESTKHCNGAGLCL